MSSKTASCAQGSEGREAAQDFFAGTFLPSFLAFERPMAIACFRLVTFFPLRPDLSLPFFISFISVSTFFPADGEYLRDEVFFAEDFLALLLFFALLDFFLVAIAALLERQMMRSFEQVVWILSGQGARVIRRGALPGCEQTDRQRAMLQHTQEFR